MIGICAGHTERTLGAAARDPDGDVLRTATGVPMAEQPLNRRILNDVKPILDQFGVEYHDPRSDQMTWANREYKETIVNRLDEYRRADADLIIDMHLNSIAPKHANHLNQVEVLYYPGSAIGACAARIIADQFGLAMSRRFYAGNLPAKTRPATNKYFLRKSPMPAVMIEPHYLSHPFWQTLIRNNHTKWHQIMTDTYAAAIIAVNDALLQALPV